MRDIKDLLDFEIYPHLDRAEADKDLEPRDKGKYYLLTCPQCGKQEAYLDKTGIYIKCNRLSPVHLSFPPQFSLTPSP